MQLFDLCCLKIQLSNETLTKSIKKINLTVCIAMNLHQNRLQIFWLEIKSSHCYRSQVGINTKFINQVGTWRMHSAIPVILFQPTSQHIGHLKPISNITQNIHMDSIVMMISNVTWGVDWSWSKWPNIIQVLIIILSDVKPTAAAHLLHSQVSTSFPL